jgi:hypothetical protein
LQRQAKKVLKEGTVPPDIPPVKKTTRKRKRGLQSGSESSQPMAKNCILWKESGRLEDLWRKEKTVEEKNVLLG